MIQKYGVIGYPLSHSLSPPMHNAAFKALGIEAAYEKYQISPETFDKAIQDLKQEPFQGLNVTIPYKRKILDHLDEIDPDARAIGAVNTVKKESSIWKGYNTDIPGFIAPLLKIKLSVRDCLILGTGGAARAVIYSTGKYLKPDHIMIAGRNEQRYKDICRQIQPLLPSSELKFLPFEKSVENGSHFDLIVNATPLGTFPDTDSTPLPDIQRVKPEAVVYDLVYNPQQTRLLSDINKIAPKAIIVNGLEMLIEQAAHSFKIWTGKEMPRGVVRKSLLEAL